MKTGWLYVITAVAVMATSTGCLVRDRRRTWIRKRWGSSVILAEMRSQAVTAGAKMQALLDQILALQVENAALREQVAAVPQAVIKEIAS